MRTYTASEIAKLFVDAVPFYLRPDAASQSGVLLKKSAPAFSARAFATNDYPLVAGVSLVTEAQLCTIASLLEKLKRARSDC